MAELGLPSRWNGEVEIVDNPFHAALARFDGTIEISLATWAEPNRRLRTTIHEALHQISQPTKAAYRHLPGWEEGVVEQMQRLLRKRVETELGTNLDERFHLAVDAGHVYNEYIAALEDVRAALGEHENRFYRMLLATRLPDRPECVRDLLERIPPSGEYTPLRTFARLHSRLRRQPITWRAIP
jgi:hypothetical protein